jgi:hypothetical protein
MTKPQTQSFIYINEMKTARIFSPYQDTVTYICGSNLKPNTSTIEPGFNDFTFKTGCTVRTSELVVFSQISTSDITDIHVEQMMPDINDVFNELSKDIEQANTVNLTQMAQDFDKLSSLIKNETVDINNVQIQLKKAKTIESLANFEPFKITVDDPTGISTTVATLSYLTIGAAFFATCCMINLICPSLFPWLIETTFDAIQKMCCCCIKSSRNVIERTFSQNVYD